MGINTCSRRLQHWLQETRLAHHRKAAHYSYVETECWLRPLDQVGDHGWDKLPSVSQSASITI